MSDNDEVSILFCSYNGERYIREQLDSIISQTHENWKLYISDDGSTDSTLAIIQEYQQRLTQGKLVILNGPAKGFAANFLSLLKSTHIASPWYAFSDQDDIWLPEKIEKALISAKKADCSQEGQAILYGGRTTLIDENKKIIGHSTLFKGKFGLENALLQSFSGGNTMLFNDVLKKIVEQLPENISIVSHDWYLYLICSAFDGVIIYDTEPQILYRQHADNLVGSNLGLLSKIMRLKKLYQGQFSEWNKSNKKSLDFYYEQLPEKQRQIVKNFYCCDDKRLYARAIHFNRAGVFRQSRFETYMFYVMNIFGKLN